MAILVGALSAKRLRHKRLLEHCMESDLEEEEETNTNVVSPRMSVMNRGGERFGGSLHWRGDLEKFDV
jgi:hypothetical protein